MGPIRYGIVTGTQTGKSRDLTADERLSIPASANQLAAGQVTSWPGCS